MDEHRTRYCFFAGLLSYPGGTDYRGPGRAVSELPPAAGDPSGCETAVRGHLAAFASSTDGLTPADMEELYTRTFDINPISSLEIGWHLYGEAYERGVFLVTMRDLLRSHGVPESAELPDHLVHVLPLLARMDDAEAESFSRTYLVPALEKMLDGFSRQTSPYEHVLRALLLAVEECHLHGASHV
jgi:nitrate reductase delta subunit